ncbi:hypothetical protein [Acinetobacter sp.]|jgi:hypothetical protein|uniref:hypothetical protein n=1 Tax=Acinetobacter sp. TaxID=472 RepID=UPI002833C39D|nr:hypothetical protein [Acinetobacter sp.]MDR0235848.1 hypothetical protein [Acinetobacter sp.]
MTIKLELDHQKLAVLSECMQNYDVGSVEDEWPNNILSSFTQVYNDGTITKHPRTLSHRVDIQELALCQKLSAEISQIMNNVEVGMGSNAGDYFQAFYIAYPNGLSSKTISTELIQLAFANTIFPLATITVEPLTTNTIWWNEVEQDGEESPESYFEPWQNMRAWFNQQQDFIDSAFIRIGDATLLEQIDDKDYPKGTIITGCVLPRLVLGLTANGSLAGLFGYVVQS